MYLFWPKPCSWHRIFVSLWWLYTMGFIHGWCPVGDAVWALMTLGGKLVGMYPAPIAKAMYPIMFYAVVLSHCGHCEGTGAGTRKCTQNLFAACSAAENNCSQLLMPLIIKCFPQQIGIERKHGLSSPSKLVMLLTCFLKFSFWAAAFGLPVVCWRCSGPKLYFSLLREVLKISEKRLL